MKVKSTSTKNLTCHGSSMEYSSSPIKEGLESRGHMALREMNKMLFKHRRCVCSSESKKSKGAQEITKPKKREKDKSKTISKICQGIPLSDVKAIQEVLGPKKLLVHMVPIEVTLRSSPWRVLKKRNTLKLRPNSFKPIEQLKLVPRDLVVKNRQGGSEVKGPPASFQVCNNCARFFKTAHGLVDHSCSPVRLGKKIYRDGDRKVYQVDGAESPEFCNNLISLARMYLDAISGKKHVMKFHFFTCYVQSKLVGFFSRLKEWLDFNVAVIFILPQEQGNGYGRFLIDLSYELSKREGRVGTPERPFSTAGHNCYLRYWCAALAEYLCKSEERLIKVKHISKATAIHPDDLVEAADALCPEMSFDGNWTFLNVFKGSEEKFVKSELDSKFLLV